MSFSENIRESAKGLKKVRVLTGSALLIAIDVIIDFARIVVSNIFEISFSFLAIAMAGMFYGPVVAAVVGAAADIIAYVIKPSGFFFPGFTLNMAVMGFIYGMFFYKKKITLKRVALAVLVESIVINLVLTPIWLNIMYGNELFAVVRVVKTAVQYPANVALCYVVCKNLTAVRNRISH
ncbi:MAG: folate family ECF transporter S component [Firmicutes bacterium]|nr:folate family ECF transporter S component [Bacillota bacterium]